MSYIVPRNKPDRCTSCPYMVKDLYDCKLQNGKRYTCIDKQYANCPLIELPPHGRLIDIKSVEDGKFVTVGNDYQRWWNGALESVIDNAPTVIEAEGETNGR